MALANSQKITIIGAGLAGSFLAILLAKRKYKVELYERLSKEEISDANSKRSYNITFRTHGIEILKKAEIWDKIQPYLLQLKGASTQLSKSSTPIISLLPADTLEYLSISRTDLLEFLLKEISDNPSISLHLETSLLSMDKHEKTIIVQNEKTKAIKTVSCDVIIGADGTNSSVRTFLQQGQHTIHSQEYSPGGYKQFTISSEAVQKLGLRNDIAYTWNADNEFILAFPNRDGSLSSLLIFPKDKNEFNILKSESAIKKILKEDFPILQPIQNNIVSQLLENPVGRFVTIHTDPWYYKDFMALIGDSAHACFPFFGQGTTAAFGDCMALIELVDRYGSDWMKIFPLYQEARKKHMDMLGELSKEGMNSYMRHKRADFESIYNKLESVGHGLFPKYIKPPVFQQISENPGKTADYVEQHNKQRKIANRVGVSFAVLLLTGMVAVMENNIKTNSKDS